MNISYATRAAAALLACASAFIAACGGGSGTTSLGGSNTGTADACPATTCGTALITMTDADGDFTSYTVDVTSLTLKRADGTVVETLPASTRVDFAKLVNLNELLAAATIPAGNYVSGSITVNYATAAVFVEVAGQSKAASVVGANGQPLGSVQLDLQLDGNRPLVIGAGRKSRLALDFNLLASNTVDTTKTPVLVTAKPFFVASLEAPDSRDTRVRGTLASVDTTGSSYTVNVRPFHDKDANRGPLTVHVTAQTTYEINGQTSTGTTGLTALAAVPAGTLTAAFGTLQAADHTFTAARVLAGTSLESADKDRVEGTVIARTGNTLTVRGATLERRDDRAEFQAGDLTLLVGSATAVTKEGVAGTSLTASAISVGQHIEASGTASKDAAGKVTVDAAAGAVRLELTRAWGTVKTANAGTLTLALQSLDDRPLTIFNFAGTGTATAQDANPASYRVDTGVLSLAALTPGKSARVYGFVSPFGMSPPDFSARSLVDFGATIAMLELEWKSDGALAPFLSMSATGLVVDKANTAVDREQVRIGPQRIDLVALASGLRIVGAGTATDSYAIGGDSQQVSMYGKFGDFVTALTAKLNGSNRVRRVIATGSYDAASNTFTASRLVVVLKGS
jgi:hypothetical protein